MRFQTTETVSTGDVEQVLHALELCLRESFDAVEREGRQIVLHGLGPSPKARNYRDRAIFEVVSSKGKTTIRADVTFQASALLGPSSQDSVVQEKLNATFEQMRARLNLARPEIPVSRTREALHDESLRVEMDERVVHAGGDPVDARPIKTGVPRHQGDNEHKETERFGESGHSRFTRAKAVATHAEEQSVVTIPVEPITTPDVEPPQVPVAKAREEAKEERTSAVSAVAKGIKKLVLDKPREIPAAEPLSSFAESIVAESVVAEPVVTESVVAEPIIAEPVVAESVAESTVAEPVVTEPIVAEPAPASVMTSIVVESPAPEASPASLEVSSSSSKAHSTVFGQLASRLDSGIRLRAVFDREGSGSEAPTLRLDAAEAAHKTGVPLLVVSILAVMVAAGSVYLYWAGLFNLDFAHRIISHPEPVTPAPPPPVVVMPQAPPPPPRHEEPNAKLWLEQWVDALRGRDPELQASFYADPVSHYLGDSTVSKDDLTTEFRSAIQARDGLWTVKLENISVNPQSSDHVLIRLTKHFMQMDSQENSGRIVDRYVRSRLELRKIDGEWKIVSEQDQVKPNGR